MINVEFQDSRGESITDIDLGNTSPGRECHYQVFRLVNTGDEDVVVQVYADDSYQNGADKKSYLSNGTPEETYKATWFSLNNFNYQEQIYVPIAAGDFVEIYVKWRPIDVSRTGAKTWGIKRHVEPANVERICDPLT